MRVLECTLSGVDAEMPPFRIVRGKFVEGRVRDFEQALVQAELIQELER